MSEKHTLSKKIGAQVRSQSCRGRPPPPSSGASRCRSMLPRLLGQEEGNAERIHIIVQYHVVPNSIRKTYQYDINIIVSRENILYDNHKYILFSPEVESAQLVLKLDIAHFFHMI